VKRCKNNAQTLPNSIKTILHFLIVCILVRMEVCTLTSKQLNTDKSPSQLYLYSFNYITGKPKTALE
jgi:hypothetical protein